MKISKLLRTAAVGAAVTTGLVLAPAEVAGADGSVFNHVLLRNTVDHSTLTRGSVQVVEEWEQGDPNPENWADARASCTDCRTVAVAFQIVLVEAGEPTPSGPVNVAIALNESCTRCETVAVAEQWVVQTPEGELSDGAEQRVRMLRSRLHAVLAGRERPIADVYAEIKAIGDELEAIANGSGVPRHRAERDARDDD